MHALDTVQRRAYCIDLPLRLGQLEQMQLRLRFADSGRQLVVRRAGRREAVVDTRSLEVASG